MAGGRDERGEERVEGDVGQGEELARVGDGEVDVCYWVAGEVVEGGGDVAGLSDISTSAKEGAKRSGIRTAQQPSMMRSCHFVPGAEGLLERFSAIRRITVSGSLESCTYCQSRQCKL